MKPVVKVWCLPHDQPEQDYNKLHAAIVDVVVETNFGVHHQNDMIVLMPMDLMKKGLGEEIVVEISFYKVKPPSDSGCFRVLYNVCRVVKELYPDAYVQGEISHPFLPDAYRFTA